MTRPNRLIGRGCSKLRAAWTTVWRRGLSHLCFPTQAHDFLDGFGPQFDVVGGNHDLEGIDEFFTDESNLEVYLRELGKKTPQFCHEVADKTLVVGLGSTKFRSAQYTSHEVVVDDEQVNSC